jgi:NAD(P)-dependent dehydrogenase (short-subunit alcohol dehydrogenase family)
VKGVLFTVQKALPLLVDGGSIILNASVSSVKAASAMSVYCATKAAVRSLLDGRFEVAKDSGQHNQSRASGNVCRSRLCAKSERKLTTGGLFKPVSPMGRLGTPDEIAKAVVFLASTNSIYITGIRLFVDGGISQIKCRRFASPNSF